MLFDKRTVSLYDIVHLIQREKLKLVDEQINSNDTDWSFIIQHKIPVQPVFIADETIVVGSSLIMELRDFMEKQEGSYLRKVQSSPITLYTVREYAEEELEKMILYFKK